MHIDQSSTKHMLYIFVCGNKVLRMIIQSNKWKELWCQWASDAQKFGINLIIDMGQIATEKDYEDDISSDIP